MHNKQNLASAYQRKGAIPPSFDTGDTPFITTGFRPQLSVVECLQSVFLWHNQTINIWTSIALVVCNSVFFADFVKNNTPVPHNVFRSICWYFGARVANWMVSFLYHTFVCHSKRTAHILCVSDYVSCCLTSLSFGTCLLNMELFFVHDKRIPLTVCSSVFGGWIILNFCCCKQFQSETYRSHRVWLIVALSSFYVIGLVVAVFSTHGGHIPKYYENLVFGLLVFEFSGAMFYVTQIPEMMSSFGQFYSSFISSHNVWHLMNFGYDFFIALFIQSAWSDLQQRLQ